MDKQIGLSFTQQVELMGSAVTEGNIWPNSVIKGYTVVEPLGAGVRVTGRDQEFRELWGSVISPPMIGPDGLCQIGLYSSLLSMLQREWAKWGNVQGTDPGPAIAKAQLLELAHAAQRLAEGINADSMSDKANARSRSLGQAAYDAMLRLREVS